MPHDPLENQKQIRIGGIKLSPELAQFSCTCQLSEPCFLAPLMASIAKQSINVVYLRLVRTDQAIRLTFSVLAEHRATVQAILAEDLGNSGQVDILPSAGTLTLFPHRNSLALLGAVLAVCGRHTLPLDGLLSSVSALTFLSAYPALDRTAEALTTVVELPENHSPIQPQSILINMVETVAVYWEPVIRVYGFEVRLAAALVELTFPLAEKEYWGRHFMDVGATGPGFLMTLAEPVENERLHCCLVLSQEALQHYYPKLVEPASQASGTLSAEIVQPVEMLFFHGPHFQDRHGIAAAFFRCLENEELSIHLVGCTGTSIYMVVGERQAERVRTLLAKEFIVP